MALLKQGPAIAEQKGQQQSPDVGTVDICICQKNHLQCHSPQSAAITCQPCRHLHGNVQKLHMADVLSASKCLCRRQVDFDKEDANMENNSDKHMQETCPQKQGSTYCDWASPFAMEPESQLYCIRSPNSSSTLPYLRFVTSSPFKPKPRPRMRLLISLFLYKLASSFFSTFRILPRRGRMAWKRLSLACFALPPAFQDHDAV